MCVRGLIIIQDERSVSAQLCLQGYESRIQQIESADLLGGGPPPDQAEVQKDRVQVHADMHFAWTHYHTHHSLTRITSITHPMDAAHVFGQAATDRLEAQNRGLSRAKDLVAEIEETAGEITSTLGENREKIESAHDKTRQVKAGLDKADTLTTRMGKWWNRW